MAMLRLLENDLEKRYHITGEVVNAPYGDMVGMWCGDGCIQPPCARMMARITWVGSRRTCTDPRASIRHCRYMVPLPGSHTLRLLHKRLHEISHAKVGSPEVNQV